MELIDNYIEYKTFRYQFKIEKYLGKYYFNMIFDFYTNNITITSILGIDIELYIKLASKYTIEMSHDNAYIYFYDKKDIELFIQDLYKEINNKK